MLRPTSRLERCLFISAFLLLTAGAGAQTVSPEMMNGLKWRLIGPFRGGRAVAAAGVPGDGATFYFGAVNGGIWKTTDAGVTWKPIFDGQAAGSIGALAVAPSDPNIIYAGTGESDIREDLSSGNGVYKSTDAGLTWNHIGLEDTRQISRIVIDAQDPNIVYVGALGHVYAPNEQRGVYKSTDGGAHWTRVLGLGSEIGISDLAMCSSMPQLLFAAAWHVRRAPWSEYAPIEEPGSGLYRSRDAGKTWSRLEGGGLPSSNWGRAGVEVAPDGRRVYALIEVKKSDMKETDAKQSGLYRSDDGGETWRLVNADPRLTSRAWYFNRVTVDPQNPDRIYMPNVAFYGSEDGGKTISVVRGAPGGDDYHQLWIDPKNSARMVLASDQGTSVSLNRGETFSSWYNQPTAQMYHVTTDNQFPYVVYGAQQDSGSAAVPSRTDHGSITPRDWFLPGSSESGYLVVDSKDPNIIYLTDTYGGVDRFNKRTGFSQNISPWPAEDFYSVMNQRKYRDPWTPVLVASPQDSSTLYLGTQYVLKTVDGGLHWEKMSPDLTGVSNEKPASAPEHGPPTLENAKLSGYGVVFTIAPSPLSREVIWAGSDTGVIQVTRDGGKSWKDVTPPSVNSWSKISLIEASHFDSAVAYAAVDRARLDDQTPYIYRTKDYGASWQLITNGIGASAFLRAIREDSQSKGLLFAGTELGVYASFDDGDHWQSLQLNLPVSGIRDLTIHGDDLVVATFGRSFWILDNITPLRQVLSAKQASGAWLLRPATAVRIDNDSFPGTPLQPEEPTAANPPDGAMIDYYLPSAAQKVQLEIFDADQKLARKFSSEDRVAKRPPGAVADRWFGKPEIVEKTAGMHRFVWNLTWGGSGDSSGDEEAEARNPAGPRIPPGTYRIRLKVDGRTQEQILKVVMDPRSSATPEILAEQFQLGRQIFDEIVQARRALAEIHSVQKQIAERRGEIEQAGSKSPQLKSALADAESDIEKILTDKNHAKEHPGLQQDSSDLASVLRVVKSGDRAVPSQALAIYKESSPGTKARIEEWSSFERSGLEKLNQQLRGADLSPVTITEAER